MKFYKQKDGFDDIREILNKGFSDDELDIALNKIEDASLNQQHIPKDIVEYLLAFPSILFTILGADSQHVRLNVQ